MRKTQPNNGPNMNATDLTIEEITRRLSQVNGTGPINHYPPGLLNGPPRPAAVLIPMLEAEDGWRLLFIRRTEIEGDRHSGQVAFPGGRQDPSDPSVEAAALREAHEEIGLDPADVQVLGKIVSFLTISNYVVTPVVGKIPWPYPVQAQPDEVDRIFTIPLAWLADPANREELKRELPDNQEISVTYFNPYDNETLWGASARFTVYFLKTLGLA